MKLTKLALCITSAMAVTACGGGSGGSSSSGDSSTTSQKVSQVVKFDTFSSNRAANTLGTVLNSDVAVSTSGVLSSSSSSENDTNSVFKTVKVCLDTNGDFKCDSSDSKYTYTQSDVLSGEATLTWDSTLDSDFRDRNILVEAIDGEGKTLTMVVPASAGGSENNRNTLYVNPISNLTNKISAKELSDITGKNESYFSPTTEYSKIEGNSELQVLSDIVASLSLDKNGFSANNPNKSTILTKDTSKSEVSRVLNEIITPLKNAFEEKLDQSKISINVSLNIIYEQNGIIDGSNIKILNNNTPDADFEFTVDNGKVDFKNLSSDKDDDFLTYSWFFGDSTSSKEANVVHNYSQKGSYKVTLIVYDGKETAILSKVVKIDSISSSLEIEPNFDIKQSSKTVAFKNTTSKNPNVDYTYFWNFGDGQTSTEESPEHTYKADGNYSVELRVCANGSCSTIVRTVNISTISDDLKADVSFNYGDNGVVTFTANPIYNGTSKELEYTWDFGDGSSSTTDSKSISHTYKSNKEYTVIFQIKDKTGLSYSKELKVKISNASSSGDVTLTADPQCVANNLSITCEAGAKYNGKGSLSYIWTFGDNSMSTHENTTHVYSKEGVYEINLKVTDSNGLSYTIPEPLKVEVTNGGIILQPSVTTTYSMTSSSSFAFTSNIKNVAAENAQYLWNFGDGSTSTEANPSHTYKANGTYTVLLTLTDKSTGKSVKSNALSVNVNIQDEICKENDPYCKGEIDPAECKQECVEKTVQVCTGDVAPTTKAAAVDSSLSSINTEYYATNPNGQLGKRKTISMTSASDWTTDMIVAQGAANDDPRAFRGYHEKATDFYALYAAWDDEKLYVMVEMPNLQNAEKCGDFDYSCDQFLPMGIGIRTGKRTLGNGEVVGGEGVWTKTPFYNVKEGFDTILMFHPRVPTVNTPGLFKTNADGKFSYDSKSGYLIGFDDAGIERAVLDGTVSKNYWGHSNNYGKGKDSYLEGGYEDLLASNAGASGRLYQVAIPLESLDITASDIENNGLGLFAFSTFGESMMDALPWTPNLIDVASEAYSKDDSTSQEKEDVDEYDVRLAAVGNLKAGIGRSGQICTTKTVTECTPEKLPDSCNDTSDIDVQVSHSEQNVGKTVKATVNVATGYKGVTYTWKVPGQTDVTSKYNETSKTFTFQKGKTAKTVEIEVIASNSSGSRTGSAKVSINVPACQGSECDTTPDTDLIEFKGIDSSNIKVYDPSNTCKVDSGSIVLKASSSTVPNIYAYVATTDLAGKWPGTAMTKVDGCDSSFYAYTPSKAVSSASVIFNEVDGGRYPAEMQPGVEYTLGTDCFDWESKTFKTLSECGMSSSAPEDTVYMLKGGNEVANNSTITISYNEENPSSAYVDVSLMIYGASTNADTEGTYTINGVTGSFVNGQIIRVGEKVEAAEDKASAVPVELTITYGNAKATYKFVKVKYQKPIAKTDFSWDNALVYFVMTDRFANGSKSNDNSYGRPYKDATGHATATFHGGDIVGMTDRLDYIKSLGMNAIWITAPYEQSHGWTGGGSTGKFAHYAYHGYYALDFTSMDANVGTVEEFRTFVKEAHKRGIRVVLDIVMNHSGYATLQDMCDYGFGVRSDGKSACDSWSPSDGNWHSKPISESKDSKWDAWWGSNWLIFGGYGDQCGSGDGLNACISYLPDFKNSSAHGSSVSIPAFLSKKWATADDKHDIPAAKAYRKGNMSVAEFQAHWLASWVEEFGIDGFRCDTAKHVTQETWKLLKQYSQEALQKWREKTSASDDVAASWTDNFWMTGEHWGYKVDESDGGGYASKGGFDSMINFSFNGQAGGSCSVPSENDWKDYAKRYGLGSASPKLNALSYVSSHDTSLCRPSDMKKLGTMLELLPGGVQVYYGDETARPNDNGGSGNDAEHGTRSDMNFPSDIDSAASWAQNVDTLSTSFSSNATLAHWQKVGQFRFRNVAVGAGKQTITSDGSYCRIYNNEDKGINNSVVIHLGSASSVAVGDCFADGTEVQDAYSGKFGKVSGGKVSISGTGDVILLELKR
ncbi:MAG: PKD domain-containing protein [Succinivibrionaceae bacterium]